MKFYLIALLASTTSASNCTKSGCFFHYTNTEFCKSSDGSGGISFHDGRCGEVDAVPHIPNDMWADQKAVDAYVGATIEFYKVPGADSDCHLSPGPCDHDPSRWIKNGTSTKKEPWDGKGTEFKTFCAEKGCKSTTPDDPKNHKYCSLCTAAFNKGVTIDYWYPLKKPTPPAPGPAPAGKTIVDLAVATPDLSTLVTALKAGKLVDTLSGAGPFTVFAPTNEAFAKLPKSLLDHLLDPKNIKELDDVLTYHVASGSVHAKDLKNHEKIKTVEGKEVEAFLYNNHVYINDAEVTTADVDASNGVVHIINHVLIPPHTMAKATAGL